MTEVAIKEKDTSVLGGDVARKESDSLLDAVLEKHGVEIDVEDTVEDKETEQQTEGDSERNDTSQTDERETGSDDAEESALSERQKDAAKYFGIDPESVSAEVLDKMALKRADYDRQLADALTKTDSSKESPDESAEVKDVPEPLTGDTLFEEPDKTTKTLNWMRDEIIAMRAELSEGREIEQERSEKRVDGVVDKFFGGLNQQFFKRYGKEPMGMLGPDSNEAKLRNELIALAEQFVKKESDWPEALETALFRIAKNDVVKMEAGRVRERNRKDNRGSMPPPSEGKKVVTPHGMDAAFAAIEKHFPDLPDT